MNFYGIYTDEPDSKPELIVNVLGKTDVAIISDAIANLNKRFSIGDFENKERLFYEFTKAELLDVLG